ncbi:dTDP-4-dehydrorhamnose reductase [archaeon]|nr:dTDP-4-dehydrorhamnose reductase [archaeon]
MVKIALIGADGMLGFALKETIQKSDNELFALTRKDLDITDSNSLKILNDIKPNIILNCAAFTNVDGCEATSLEAYETNSIALINLIKSANKHNACLVHFSTDYVFDGNKDTPYSTDDKPNPNSIYGKSKLMGESIIQTMCDNHLIIRTSWLFGPNGKNFVDTILNLADKNKELSVVDDQRGCPTYTFDLAEATMNALDQRGVIHLTGKTDCTWFELAKHVIKEKSLDNTVAPISTSKAVELFNLKATRPTYSVLESTKELRGYEESVKEYLSQK